MQRPRTGHVRTAALGTVIGLCLLIPLAAASADSADEAGPRPSAPAAQQSLTALDFGTGVLPGASKAALPDVLKGSAKPKGSASPASSASSASSVKPVAARELCGPAVDGPGGVRAQTCLEQDGGEVWGRVHYRNPTTEELVLAMNVTPDGGAALQVECTVPARETEGRCESPRVRSAAPLEQWSSIAELAASGPAGGKILRAGSQRP